MAFRKDRTTSANASLMTAGTIVEALITQGVLKTVAEAENALIQLAEAGLDFATPVVEADNKLFAEEESKDKPAKGSSSKSSGKAPSGDPGEVVFYGGKFKGCTISEVFYMSKEDAEENFGHKYGDGSTYITDYVATDKNKNDTTREAAQAFIKAVK